MRKFPPQSAGRLKTSSRSKCTNGSGLAVAGSLAPATRHQPDRIAAAYCGFGYFDPGQAMDERPFESPPDIEDRCLACDDAYIRIPRIPPRPRLGAARGA